VKRDAQSASSLGGRKRDRAAVVACPHRAEERLHDFADLPGIRGGKARGPMAASATAFIAALRSHRVVSGAGDHGSVTVWRDDAGKLRCAFSRYRAIVDTREFSTKLDVRCWLAKWLPRMHAPLPEQGPAT
jgi:hypothetical protein